MPKHRSFTVRYKLEAIDWYNTNGRNIAKTAREFNVDRKRVRDWLANEYLLRTNVWGAASKKRIGGGTECASMELDIGVQTYDVKQRYFTVGFIF